MPSPVSIEEGGHRTKVTTIGELVVGAYDHDDKGVVNLDQDNVAENLFLPKVGSRLVLTGCIVSAARNIATDVLVDIYEATSITDTVIASSILELDMPKSTLVPLFPLNLLISEGAFVNAKADDSNVRITLFGHYVPASA